VDRHRHGEPRGENNRRDTDADAEHVPRDELARAIGPAVARCEHRTPAEIALDISR
jgi:hypothetical protein